MELIDVLLWAASAPEDHLHKVQLLLQRINPPNREWLIESQKADDRQEIIDRLASSSGSFDLSAVEERIAKHVGANAYQPSSKTGKRWWKYLQLRRATAETLADIAHGNKKAIATTLLSLMKRGIVQRERVEGVWVYEAGGKS